MGNNAIIRYAVQITCLSDYFCTGKMDRFLETDLTADKCVSAICKLGKLLKDENYTNKKEIENAWSMYSAGKQGTTNNLILSIKDEWNFKTALIEYKTTMYDILAVQKLKQLYVANGGDMYAMEKDLGIYRWILVASMEFQDRIPRVLRNVLTKHLNAAEELSWKEIRQEMDNLRAENKAK